MFILDYINIIYAYIHTHNIRLYTYTHTPSTETIPGKLNLLAWMDLFITDYICLCLTFYGIAQTADD